MKALRAELITSLAALFLAVVFAASGLQAQVNVITWHNDNWRTGQNVNETALTTSTVTKNTFGKLCSVPFTSDGGVLDGQVYAQPLVVWDAANHRNVVYVVTENDSIFAFNGTNCNLIASNTNLIPRATEAPADCRFIGGGACATVSPMVGILGTPVIDLGTNTIYLVTESQSPPTSPTTWFHKIHALDLTTLAEKTTYKSPQVVKGKTQGVTFVARSHIQRPGLLWLSASQSGQPNNTVYVAFSMMDGVPGPHPRGWILGFNAQNLQSTTLAYSPVPGAGLVGGGIWQAGAGLAAGVDQSGTTYIYFSTADGTFDLTSGGMDAADSLIKLTTSLQYPSGSFYFTPSDQYSRQCSDLDYASGGVVLIPDGSVSGNPLVAVKGDKENYLWAVDRTSLGGFNPGACSTGGGCPSSCAPSGWVNNNLQTLLASTNNKQARSTPAFWSGNNGNLYFAASYDTLNEYPLFGSNNCTPGPVLCSSAAVSHNSKQSIVMGYSITPSVSSGPAPLYQNGLVWAIKKGQYGSGLYTFDAGSLNELYGADLCPIRDKIGAPTKFSVPTIANGFVYVGTEQDFNIFGPTSVACN
jgi:hypothetical protein